MGAVAIYPSGEAPAGVTDLGVVEVHASQEEGTVDVLLPQFARRVAELGGDVAVIDGVRARFLAVPRMQVERYYYNCGWGVACGGVRSYQAADEVMVVAIYGRAFTTTRPASSAAPRAPSDAAGEELRPRMEAPRPPPPDGAPPPEPAPPPGGTSL